MIDELVTLKDDEHQSQDCDGYALYVTYQKPVQINGSTVIPRTFEDALVFENHDALNAVTGSRTSEKIQKIVDKKLTGDELADTLFILLKDAEKGAFALDCLMLEDPKNLKAPAYIQAGLTWFENALNAYPNDSSLSEASA